MKLAARWAIWRFLVLFADLICETRTRYLHETEASSASILSKIPLDFTGVWVSSFDIFGVSSAFQQFLNWKISVCQETQMILSDVSFSHSDGHHYMELWWLDLHWELDRKSRISYLCRWRRLLCQQSQWEGMMALEFGFLWHWWFQKSVRTLVAQITNLMVLRWTPLWKKYTWESDMMIHQPSPVTVIHPWWLAESFHRISILWADNCTIFPFKSFLSTIWISQVANVSIQ